MNVLTERYLSDMTQWSLNPVELREDLIVRHDGYEVVKIEDVYAACYLADGSTDKYGNKVWKRVYTFRGDDGIFHSELRPFRGRVYLEPLETNPMTLDQGFGIMTGD